MNVMLQIQVPANHKEHLCHGHRFKLVPYIQVKGNFPLPEDGSTACFRNAVLQWKLNDGKSPKIKRPFQYVYKRFRIKLSVKDVCPRLAPSMFSFNPYEGKGNFLNVLSPSKYQYPIFIISEFILRRKKVRTLPRVYGIICTSQRRSMFDTYSRLPQYTSSAIQKYLYKNMCRLKHTQQDR